MSILNMLGLSIVLFAGMVAFFRVVLFIAGV